MNTRSTGSKWFPGFNRMLYEPVRFLTMEALYSSELTFSEIKKHVRKDIPDLTDGNLAGHLAYLENASYIKGNRYFEERKPTTRYEITQQGKKSFEKFFAGLAKRLYKAFEVTNIEMPDSFKSLFHDS